ncbi:MAG TPA: PP2C family protein-serine/threonine phosphatase, partial [Vicinamibacterales bacterium]|nr:PP2C family protein-serine/threonine phosphatase [Vicinamibacterales bacterium]
ADGAVTRLETGGTLIGAFADAVYEQGVVRLAPGDTLVVFSDGVSEAVDVAGDEFGDARLSELVLGLLHETPERLVRAAIERVVAFGEGVGQHDDVTVLVLRAMAPDARAVAAGPSQGRPD